MDRGELFQLIRTRRSFLCIGLDSDITKIPRHLLGEDDPLFAFNRAIIDATHNYAVAYKPNVAFYESLGTQGWTSLEKTIHYLKKFDVFTIADAKRGDIGNTSSLYARAFFGTLDFDAVTVAPYMGSDSVKPFLDYTGKWVILLALTSNKGASDFQFQMLSNENRQLYEEVLNASRNWGTSENMMYVVGATQAEMLTSIREIVPDHFLLVPGIGAQGGSLEDVVRFGINKQCGLLVNSSRNIIYASTEKDFADAAAREAKKLRDEMEEKLLRYNLI